MYLLFRDKNIMPGSYYNLPEGEKVVVRAFMEKFYEELSK